MDKKKKAARYSRIYDQLTSLLKKSSNPLARKATVIAVLHHKMEYFFWTGFYMLVDDELTVEMYQGPVACQVLAKDRGVCRAAINQQKTLVVENVEEFPGHIACDSRSKSEIVIPLRNSFGEITGVLDVDSKDLASFDEVDAEWLEKICKLLIG
ncbi:MAG: histidine kinase [Bacteroidetes bacterium GWF2_42_66]|nr:MAG: histidine kinase [Bacteroidetes bacterium GWA2_42_15]OFX98010.1 MAG: histidine kinase [Bacteroidetes bacterium GWE2_42_39]OFY45853.1 MAG: histidine kinase [Bacteroidetes bacterium GWF2_42_66]HBL74730.1 histidine kinase [Prolixibacteraceae bacterium]HCR89392.1 histidine kinase [Prolixibacteraceae bacterium]